MGRRTEQIPEATQDVRSNRIPLVLGEVEARRPLAGEDVEMVEPEIDQHFLELTFTVGSTNDLLLHQLGEHGALRPRRLLLFRRAHFPPRDVRIRCVVRGRAAALLLLLPPQHHGRNEVLLREFLCGLRQRLKRRQSGRESGIGNLVRMELLLDVGLEADTADGVDVTCPRSEPEAVQHVHDSAIVRVFRNDVTGAAGLVRRCAGAEHGRCNHGRDERPENRPMVRHVVHLSH